VHPPAESVLRFSDALPERARLCGAQGACHAPTGYALSDDGRRAQATAVSIAPVAAYLDETSKSIGVSAETLTQCANTLQQCKSSLDECKASSG
jgi:hypothetical protein